MNQFTDKTGKTWELALTLGDVRRVRHECGVDLGELLTKPVEFAKALSDFEKLGALLWILCESQATGITPDAFAYRFDGRTLQSAYQCLVGAVADFYQSPEMAKTLKARLGKLVESQDRKNASTLSKKLDSASAGSLE